MRSNTIVALCGIALIALAVACGQTPMPVSPSPVAAGSTDVGPGGSTLKVPAPVLQSPANGVQLTITSNVPLISSNVAGTYTTVPVTLEFEVRNAAGAVVANPKLTPSSGTTTTYTFGSQLETSAVYSWRTRGTYSGANGPWSNTFTFKAPDIPPAYIKSSEIFDPLTDGKGTIGTPIGQVVYIAGRGAQMVTQNSSIRFSLPVTLQEGSMSLMATNYDEGTPGDKSKIMCMQEGTGEITDNDYRMTVEKRGAQYSTPGAVTFRIIAGGGEENIHDGPRVGVDFSDELWYLWKFSWTLNSARLQVRRTNESGAVIYDGSVAMRRAYRPVPHTVYVGCPVGRAGALDATVPGMIVKNFWVSGNSTRPPFPFPAFFNPPGGQ